MAYGPEGQVHQATSTGIPGERTTTLPSDQPGTCQIQLYNHLDGVAIQYALQSEAVD